MNIVDKTISILMNNKAYEAEPGLRPMVQQLGIKCQESKQWIDHVTDTFEEFEDEGYVAGRFLALGYAIREIELREGLSNALKKHRKGHQPEKL